MENNIRDPMQEQYYGRDVEETDWLKVLLDHIKQKEYSKEQKLKRLL